MAMLRRHAPGWSGRLILLVAAGIAVGTLAGFQVAAIIDRAGIGTTGHAAVPLSTERPVGKTGEEDRAMGAALAAALHADEVADCVTLEPRHRAGCRDHVAERARAPRMFEALPRAEANGLAERASATDWPAAFD